MKRLIKVLALVLCLSLLAACMPRSGGGGSDGGEERPPLETDTVRLALFSNGHIFNAIAEEQGYLEDEGLTVVYVKVENDDEVFEGIRNGTIDVASNSGTNLPLQHISEGMDLTIFAGYMLTGCKPIFTRVETEWHGIADLYGKTMACEPNLFAITGPLMDLGYNPLREVRWIDTPIQEDRITAVLNGEADYGLVGTSLNYAVITNPELKICTYASDILPDYSCCRVEAMTSWVLQNPNTVKALLRAWIRAMAYYDSHHDEAVALTAELVGQDEAYVRAYLDNPHCELNVDPMKSSIKRAWNYMDDLGLLDSRVQQIRIDDHINVTLYKEALDECQALYGSEYPEFYERMQAQFAEHNQ